MAIYLYVPIFMVSRVFPALLLGADGGVLRYSIVVLSGGFCFTVSVKRLNLELLNIFI